MLTKWLARPATLVVCALLLIGSSSPAFARNRKSCREHLRHAESNLHAAVRKHGERSEQAQKKRQEVEKIRAECHM